MKVNLVKMTALDEIKQFLGCETPDQWIKNALDNQEIMLIDHAHCERKAASTAIQLMYRYMDKLDLQNKMSRLAREELRHFEQVLAILKDRNIKFKRLSAARYASGLRELVRGPEPGQIVDVLIIGAFIEARSCERFNKLAPYLDDELNKFYMSLLKSESRHYQDYLKLAQKYAGEPIEERINIFREKENELILSPDESFKFHSGPVA